MNPISKHSPCDLPVGTIVLVTQPFMDEPPWRGRIVGTDVFGSKYHIGREQLWRGEGHFGDGGWWVFPGQVKPIADEGATR